MLLSFKKKHNQQHFFNLTIIRVSLDILNQSLMRPADSGGGGLTLHKVFVSLKSSSLTYNRRTKT